MKSFLFLRFPVIILLALLLLSCATGPSSDDVQDREPPEWVVGALPESPDVVYFSGSGEDPEGSQVRAEQDATASLVAEITRYLGVRVEAETEAVAAASLDDFESRVTQTVRQRSGARIEGLRVEDRYVESDDGEVRVYLLAGYERAALEAERQRLTAVFEQQVEAVEGTAERAREHAERGEYFAALRLYLQAAEAALESDLEDASRNAGRNARAAREIAENLRLRSISDSPITAELYSEHQAGRDPVPGADIRISYPAEGPGGRTIIRSERTVTDGRGRIRYSLPQETALEHGSVHVSLDLDSLLRPLRRTEVSGEINAIAEAVRATRLRIDYDRREAGSEATGDRERVSIVVTERNDSGEVVQLERTAGTLRQALGERGYRVVESAFSSGRAAGLSQQQVVARAREALPAVELVLIAEVSVSEVVESPEPLVRVDGNFSLLDADSGVAVASWSGFARSPGSSLQSAENAAFRRIGTRAAEELAGRVP